ncbi:MAG: hypothetical protein KDK39_19370 [Leptospiraceae bacterium]|nr:hypothetical protein [Leptospiraceae bacterium]
MLDKIQDLQGFTQEFLKHYLANGFGGMQKRDLDTLIFGLLYKHGAFGNPVEKFDITEVSFQLGISVTRVRNLLRDSQLRYLQYDEHEAKRRFVDLLESSRFERTGSYITFSVCDPLLQQYFMRWVNQVNGFYDTTFNPNLIKISYEVLADVCLLLADQETLEIFKTQIEDQDILFIEESDGIDDRSLVQRVLESLTNGLAQDVVKDFIVLAIKLLIGIA